MLQGVDREVRQPFGRNMKSQGIMWRSGILALILCIASVLPALGNDPDVDPMDPSLWICNGSVTSYIYVSQDGVDSSESSAGTIGSPYKTIQYAVDQRGDGCTTVYVMNGTYTPKNFGRDDNNFRSVVDLTDVVNLRLTNLPGHRPILRYDGPAGILAKSLGTQSNIEISGLEIEGQAAEITFQQAKDARLTKNRKYNGVGVNFRQGHHIWIHDMKVHHCPSSGIRINKGDYSIIADNEVFNNTFWTSSATSAIVFAESKNIDNNFKTKMIITRNVVYGNVNKIPFYNPNLAWNFSPIAFGIDCSVQACNCTLDNYPQCLELAYAECPRNCRYGKLSQNYIIDGMGVYATRNKDTYLKGKMELTDNICYENGINGVVFHRSDRGIIRGNTVFDNGVVPRRDIAQPLEDWMEDIVLEGRQPYSGIVINNAVNVRLWNNNVMSRFQSDAAYQEIADGGNTGAIAGGGNNKYCRGRVSPSLEPYVVNSTNDVSKCRPLCSDSPNYSEIDKEDGKTCLCAPGNFGNGYATCSPCPVGQVSRTALPGNGPLEARCRRCRESDRQVFQDGRCVCVPGTYGDAAVPCQECPVGMNGGETSPGTGNMQKRCGTCGQTKAYSPNATKCVCGVGAYGSGDGTCTTCPVATVPTISTIGNGSVYERCSCPSPAVLGPRQPRLPKYYLAKKGLECPSSDVVSTLEGCKEYAKMSGIRFSRKVNSAFYRWSRPFGCFWDRNGPTLYFNVNKNAVYNSKWGGIRGVCVQFEAQVENPDVYECLCPPGMFGNGNLIGNCTSCPAFTKGLSVPGNGPLELRCQTCNDEDNKQLQNNRCVCKSGFYGHADQIGGKCTPCPDGSIPFGGASNGPIAARCQVCFDKPRKIQVESECGVVKLKPNMIAWRP